MSATRMSTAVVAALLAAASALVGVAPNAQASPDSPAAPPPGPPEFADAVHLPGTAGRTEPRSAFDESGHGSVITNLSSPSGGQSTGDAVVFTTADHGLTWQPTAAEPAGQSQASSDVDIVALTKGAHAGRQVATELDFTGINFRTSYSDDGGRTWTASTGPGLFTGTGYADTDRPWLATGGPVDPATGEQDVYLLFHNLVSGTANHNMFVAKSSDGGATWSAPLPITLPGSQAYADLQCADSGGPSNLFVDPATGRLYAAWGTRSAQPPLQGTGGCGASVTGTPEINVVAATRVWMATTADPATPGSWTTSLAVDDNPTGQIVGMQLSPGAIDSAGNVYIAYAESPGTYPNYDGAAIKLLHNGSPLLQGPWSRPVVVAPGAASASASDTTATPGNVLPHILAGAPGRVALAYFHGVARPGATPGWHVQEADTTDALAAHPTFHSQDISFAALPAAPGSTAVSVQDATVATGTASQLMGACGTGPTAGVQNGLVCSRATDVWGAAVDPVTCSASFSWPLASTDSGFNDSFYASDARFFGTYVSTQTGGRTLC